mgnify:CR=1 FL=1|tara:strand:+ start:21268 stop:21597 length:330 start_codon:yes stop_codon:yes gene_type:complete
MTTTPDHMRLQRQVEDASARLVRTTGQPVFVAAVQEFAGGQGVAFSIRDASLGQVERVLYMLLANLADSYQTGTVEGCETCTAAYARVRTAAAALLPVFDDVESRKGCH